jgi:L-2-hydroxyglutarate oxidase LhgO
MAYKTAFTPKNTKKYVGNPTKIVCRSLWERRVCKFLDETPNILKWSFEEIIVPYMNPLDKKIHNYYPDFMVQFKDKTGIKSWMIEVKPKKQTYLKENASKKEKITWIVNNAKWEAAKKYCELNNIEFKLLTEKELFTNA